MLSGHGDDIQNYDEVKINFSSNIYGGFSHEGLFRYLKGRLSEVVHYPEPEPLSLEAELAKDLRIDSDEVMVTNGATEAIYLIAQTFSGAVSAILQPTFSEYADACRIHKHTVRNIYSLPSSFRNVQVVWLCNPNNPTGMVTDKKQLMQLIEENPDTVFVLDASYSPFTLRLLPSAAELVEHPNVLMLHSMTKQFSIPGLRLGYVSANRSLLQRIRLQRMPWSVNQLALDAGHYLLCHQNDYLLDIGQLMAERERMTQELSKLGVIDVWQSDSHMLLCRLRIGNASALKEFLIQDYGILIRDASNFNGLDKGCFRISVQSPEEDDELLKAIAEWICLV